MTGDLITAAFEQLAAPRERIDQLDRREADHYGKSAAGWPRSPALSPLADSMRYSRERSRGHLNGSVVLHSTKAHFTASLSTLSSWLFNALVRVTVSRGGSADVARM
jgi:hypothetical protein